MWGHFWRLLRSCNKISLNTPQWSQGWLSPISCGKLIVRELKCCGGIIPERRKTPFVEILLELSTIQLGSSIILVEKAEDTPDWVCQGGMFSTERCTQGLVSIAARGTWMEEEVEREKRFGVFLEAKIVTCCGGSFMNEYVMYSKTKRWDTKQL